MGQVRLSKSDKNIGEDGWRVDNLFEAADSVDVLVNLRITPLHHLKHMSIFDIDLSDRNKLEQFSGFTNIIFYTSFSLLKQYRLGLHYFDYRLVGRLFF